MNRIENVYQNDRVISMCNERSYINVNVEGRPVQFEVGSGSGYTFLPRYMFFKLGLNTPLLPTSIGFQSYTQNIFVPDGKIKVNIEYNSKLIQDEIFIMLNEYSALLGRSWIRRLQIDLTKIDYISSDQLSHHVQNIYRNETDEIIAMFPKVFEEKIGCVPNHQVKLKLRKKTSRVFHRERDLP